MSLPFSYLDTDPVLIPSYDAVKYTSTPKQWTDKPHIKPEATLYINMLRSFSNLFSEFEMKLQMYS